MNLAHKPFLADTADVTTSANNDHTRQYLARVVPWPQDGEQPSYVNVHWTSKRPDRDKPFWMGRATRSVDEAAKTVKWAMSLPDTRDIYVCLSSQRVAEPKTSAKGTTYLSAVRSQDNAVALKSLFLDIDIKEGAGYPDITSAEAALVDFIEATNLPPPTIVVASGGGLHVYWTMMRALVPHEWQPLADALATAAKQHGLKCDTVCTVDSARILRVPDTLNRKLETPRPVRLAHTMLDFDYSVERIERALKPYMKAAEPPALPPRPALPGISDLAAGIETKAWPIDIDNVAAQCAFIKEAIDTAGAGFANPLWNLTTLISVFSTGLEQDAHRMASGHTGYTVESTQELFERKQREKEAKGLGWPSCKSISFAGCDACDACPHKDAGKSPLNFGKRPTQAHFLGITSKSNSSGGQPAIAYRPPIEGGAYNRNTAMQLMNERYFLIREAGETSYFTVTSDRCFVRISAESISTEVANCFVEISENGTAKRLPIFKWWMQQTDRAGVREGVFRPHGEIASYEFNLWHGFAVTPCPGWRLMRRLMHHIWSIICRRDATKFKYLVRWLAWAVQNPEKPAEVAVVLRSTREGSGKSTLGNVMAKIFGAHGLTIHDKERLIGKHAAHIEFSSFVLLDEVFFAGDKSAADHMKGLLTSPTISIEPKFKSTRMVPNRLHAMMTTNHDWAVPAGDGARRYFVLDVSAEKARDNDWFGALNADLAAGGYEQFLSFLMRLRIDKWHPREMPRTRELGEQQRMSASSTHQWLLACADADKVVGAKTPFGAEAIKNLGATYPTSELFAAYLAYVAGSRVRPDSNVIFGKRLTSIFGPNRRMAPSNGSRPWGYEFPPADLLREKVLHDLGIAQDAVEERGG